MVTPALTARGSIFEAINGAVMDTIHMTHGEPPDTPQPLPAYDFVIIGAGTAGCILANRLTEVDHFNVSNFKALWLPLLGSTRNFEMLLL